MNKGNIFFFVFGSGFVCKVCVQEVLAMSVMDLIISQKGTSIRLLGQMVGMRMPMRMFIV